MIRAKKSIENLKPYVNGNHTAELIRHHKKIIKLDSNEATIGPSPQVMARLMHYLQNGPLNWYPDVESSELCKALSKYIAVPQNFILTFNGSDHALETVARTFLSPQDEVISLHPSYDHFRVYAETCDAHLVPLTHANDENFLKQLQAMYTQNTKLVYVVNPNNPTGTLLKKETLLDAVTAFPELLFVIDEAYFEFCGVTLADHVLDCKNLIVCRSFSKAFGLAALRCGYLVANPKLCDQIAKVRVGKNINAIAQVAACASLDDIGYMQRYVNDVHDTKDWLVSQLRNRELEVRPTPANFILVKVAKPAQVIKALAAQNVYIRDRSHLPELAGFLRITIGDQLIMKRFWKIFESLPQHLLFDQDSLSQKIRK